MEIKASKRTDDNSVNVLECLTEAGKDRLIEELVVYKVKYHSLIASLRDLTKKVDGDNT